MAETEQYEQQEFTQFDGQNGQYDENASFTQQMECQETSIAGSGDNKSEVNDDEDDRKLFVGGLSWETTAKDLKDYFGGKFGEVTSSTLKTDLESKRSRGFGFVVFKDVDSLEKALAEKEHKLHGRNIDPKRANPRTGGKKIFVGKLDPAIKEDEIRTYFETFGKVEKIDLPYDKTKEQRRAFCFVEFDTEDGMRKVLDCKTHKISNETNELDIRRATPTSGRGGRGGRGGYGGGWGFGGRGGRGGWGQGGWGQGYNSNYYNNYNNGYGGGGYGGYGGYGGGYGGYGGYDYNQYGWGGYDQGNYGYGGGYGGYDYGGWGYGQDQGQQSSYGKAPKRGGGNYHPYNRS